MVPPKLDPVDFVGDPNNAAGKSYLVLLDGNAPPEIDPNDELDDAIRAANNLAELKNALIGRAGHRGKT